VNKTHMRPLSILVNFDIESYEEIKITHNKRKLLSLVPTMQVALHARNFFVYTSQHLKWSLSKQHPRLFCLNLQAIFLACPTITFFCLQYLNIALHAQEENRTVGAYLYSGWSSNIQSLTRPFHPYII